MESTSFLAGIGAAVASPLKITEKVFEIRAVDRQASSLLETINQVNGQLEVARNLRKQKSGLLSITEKKHMEDTFSSTDRAIGLVSGLVEKCRVALKTKNGNVAMRTKIMFVLRDSPRIQTSLQQLTIAGQSLNILCLLLVSREHDEQRRVSRSLSDTPRGPPSYEEHSFLNERRSRNLLRRASNSVSSIGQYDHEAIQRSDAIPDIPEDHVGSFHWDTASEKTRRDRDELFLEQFSSHDYSSSHLPYGTGRTSASMASLQSMSSAASESPRSYTYSPVQGMADGFKTLSIDREKPRLGSLPKAFDGVDRGQEEPSQLQLGGQQPVISTSLIQTRRSLPPDQDSLSSIRTATTNRFRLPRRPTSSVLTPESPLLDSSPRLETSSLAATDSIDSPTTSHPVFVLETSEDVVAKPLFHKMVKIDLTEEDYTLSEQTSDGKVAVQPQALVESEYPEVVVADSSPEPIPISAESADGMLTRARSKRYINVESLSRRTAAAMTTPPIPNRGPEFAPEVVVAPPVDLSVPRPSTAQSQKDSDVSSVRSLGVAANQAVGRARSRKWQEMQYEKSEKLAKAGTAN